MKPTKTQRADNEPTRRSLQAKVRRRLGAMDCISTLAADAVEYADDAFAKRPRAAAVRLAVTFREIASQLPKETLCRQSAR